MYSFVSEQQENTSSTIEDLISALIELENSGNISDEDTDECFYYLQKIVDITGSSINFDEYYDESET